jgi:hypothetical protein
VQLREVDSEFAGVQASARASSRCKACDGNILPMPLYRCYYLKY